MGISHAVYSQQMRDRERETNGQTTDRRMNRRTDRRKTNAVNLLVLLLNASIWIRLFYCCLKILL